MLAQQRIQNSSR